MAESTDELREKVAVSCRILAMEGLVDEILGHVGVRMPAPMKCGYAAEARRRRAYATRRSMPLRRVDFDGKGPHKGEQYQVPNELPIHGEIYKKRPEVDCVIHAHPKEALICGVTEFKNPSHLQHIYNMQAMRMALECIPVFPRSFSSIGLSLFSYDRNHG